MKRRLPVVAMLGWLSASSMLSAAETTTSKLGMRFDCTHHFNRNKGSKQDCINVTGLRFRVQENIDDKIKAELTVDPFATTAEHYDFDPHRAIAPQVKDTPLAFIDQYSLTWFARANMSVAIEDFRGSTNLPKVSGLAFAGSLEDTPWDQTAMTLRYAIPVLKNLDIQVTLGNGEGENVGNVDAQQFVGLKLGINILDGLLLMVGTSHDGNNVGSAAYEWAYGAAMKGLAVPNLGFATQRYALALDVDGKVFGAQGLRLAGGWQRTLLSDLDKDHDVVPATLVISDVDLLLVEDPAHRQKNAVTKDVIALGVSYKILATYVVGLSYQQRSINTGHVDYFEQCEAIAATTCTQPGTKGPDLGQSALGGGIGMNFTPDLSLTLEYYRQTYDDLYANFHYVDPTDKATETLELFNARVAYRWD